MIENNNISPMQSDFEQIKKLAEDGQEYWTSRELCKALGYIHIRSSPVFLPRSLQLPIVKV